MAHCLNDYEVISVSEGDSNSTSYKVKNKKTRKVFECKTFSYEDFDATTKSTFFDEITNRKRWQHDNLVQFEEYLHHEGTQTVYLLVEHCHNGNLKGIIQKCVNEDKYVHEDFIWYFFYKAATIANDFREKSPIAIDVDNIYLDKNYSIKLLFLNTCDKTKTDMIKIVETALKLCLRDVNVVDIVEAFNYVPDYYSKELKAFLKFASKADTIDLVLEHPAIMLRLGLPQKTIFKLLPIKKNADAIEDTKAYLDNLRNREKILRIKEQQCYEQVCNLRKREHKIALMERQAKETMQKAQLYLKRSREGVLKRNKMPKDDLECTYASCGEVSFIRSTSCKSSKEVRFSDRQVSFKAHSPLKTLHNNTLNDKTQKKKSKRRFSIFSDRSFMNQQQQQTDANVDVKPILWDDDTKKQAFNLLHLMNKQCNIDGKSNVKHTYL